MRLAAGKAPQGGHNPLVSTKRIRPDTCATASCGHIDSDLAKLFRRLLFNISIANRDDHLRNHGFLWQSTGWRLAPAFDVNPNTAKREHALDVGAPYADAEGALSAAFATHAYYRLSEAQANTILEEVLQAASPWCEVAHQLGIGSAEQRRMQACVCAF